MERLQIENQQLKSSTRLLQQENEQLRRRNTQLQYELVAANKTIRELQTECMKIELSPTHIILDTVKYLDTNKPFMSINCFKIEFESSNAKEAQLAKIICQPRNLAKMAKSPVSTEVIYDWYKNPEGWFDITSEERTTFEKSLYNSFRRLNDKLTPFFRTKNYSS